MKGIAHFVTGVAVATFFPEIVHSASQSLAFGPVLAGFAGLLPDTLDFKFARYFDRPDEEIDPAEFTTQAGLPDAQAMAERLAASVHRAYETGEQVKVLLHTVKLGADQWRQWSVEFDAQGHQVLVRIGPVVTTSRVPLVNSLIPGVQIGRAQIDVPIFQTYGANIDIDAFSGPSLTFERMGDAVEVTFLPWHRRWSHSALLALFLGAMGWLFAPAIGLAMGLAVVAHILEDQMGFMGSNMFFPITRKRMRGLGLFLSGDPIPNLMTVWIGLAVTLLNLDRFSTAPNIPAMPYVVAVIVLPCLVFVAYGAWGEWRSRRQGSRGRLRAAISVPATAEALDEMDGVDILDSR